jgi:hypothetical protein
MSIGLAVGEEPSLAYPPVNFKKPPEPAPAACGQPGCPGGLADERPLQGVLHYQDGNWKTEVPEVPVGSGLSVAGDRTVVVIARVYENGPFAKGPLVFRSWQRSAKGEWSAAVDPAKQEQPLSHKHDGVHVSRLGLVVQAYAPPNFVPVAWTCEGEKWIKLFQVLVAEEGADSPA